MFRLKHKELLRSKWLASRLKTHNKKRLSEGQTGIKVEPLSPNSEDKSSWKKNNDSLSSRVIASCSKLTPSKRSVNFHSKTSSLSTKRSSRGQYDTQNKTEASVEFASRERGLRLIQKLQKGIENIKVTVRHKTPKNDETHGKTRRRLKVITTFRNFMKFKVTAVLFSV